jgi:L-lactate permease
VRSETKSAKSNALSSLLTRFSALFLYRLVAEQMPADLRALTSFKVRVVIAKFLFDFALSCKAMFNIGYVCYYFLHTTWPTVVFNDIKCMRSLLGDGYPA